MRSAGTSVRRIGTALVVGALLLTAACTSSSEGAEPAAAGSTSGTPSESASATPSPSGAPVQLAVSSPADRATAVPTSSGIALTSSGGVRSVALVAADGTRVAGSLDADGRSWTPGTQLAYSTTYRATVTAADGANTKTLTTSFTTMARPSAITGADLYVADGDVVGVGMPVVVEFTRKVARDQRAAIERRLFVTTEPKVEGAWHWFSDSEVHFRPRDYWTRGTKVSVRLAIGGMPMGFGRWGKRDRFASFTVGSAVTSVVDNASKSMTVYQDGAVLRKFPISLGRAKYPTPSGTLVVMERKESAIFDSSTYGLAVDSPDGYRQKVNWNTRVTWGGIFVHSAPWSVADQGHRNVSHGCVNAAPVNARWFYDLSKKGDIVTIRGTERRVAQGDGWTDWTMSWETFKAGSALAS